MYSRKENTKNQYLASTSWLFFEKIFRITIGFTVGIWTARHLGPEQFGLLSYAQSFALLFAPIAAMGLDGVVIRELIKNPTRSNVLLGSSFTIKLTGTAISLTLLGIATLLISSDETTKLIIFLVSLGTLFQSFNVIDLYFQSKVTSKFVALSQLASMSIANVTKIMLILYNAPLIWFAIIISIEAAITALGLIIFYKKQNLSPTNWKVDLTTTKELAAHCWPLLTSGIMVGMFQNIDQIMITHILGSNENGQYAAAVRINTLFSFFVSAYLLSITPRIYAAKEISLINYDKEMQKTFKIITFYAVICAIGTLLLSNFAIAATYGEKYALTASILNIYVISSIFSYLGAVSSRWYIAENLSHKILLRNSIGLVANVILNYIFIYRYGVLGAAISAVFTQFIANVLFDFFDLKTRKLGLMKLTAFLFWRA